MRTKDHFCVQRQNIDWKVTVFGKDPGLLYREHILNFHRTNRQFTTRVSKGRVSWKFWKFHPNVFQRFDPDNHNLALPTDAEGTKQAILQWGENQSKFHAIDLETKIFASTAINCSRNEIPPSFYPLNEARGKGKPRKKSSQTEIGKKVPGFCCSRKDKINNFDTTQNDAINTELIFQTTSCGYLGARLVVTKCSIHSAAQPVVSSASQSHHPQLKFNIVLA